MPVSVFIIFSRSFFSLTDAVSFLFLFCFSRTPSYLFYFLVWFNLICWSLKLLARALVLDVCLLSIQVMYIDVVPEKFIWTVNWLHYLNYEPIARTSSTRHLVRTRNVLGHTVSS